MKALLALTAAMSLAGAASADVITTSTTVSQSAKNVDVWFTISDANASCSATVHADGWPSANNQIGTATISAAGGPTARSAQITIDDAHLSAVKYFEIQCTDSQGNYQRRIHQVPRPPMIQMRSSIDANDVLAVEVLIDNQQQHGECWQSNLPVEFDVLGLNGASSKFFHTNFFSASIATNNQTPSQRAVIYCKNDGGVSTAANIWARENHIGPWRLWTDEVVYQ